MQCTPKTGSECNTANHDVTCFPASAALRRKCFVTRYAMQLDIYDAPYGGHPLETGGHPVVQPRPQSALASLVGECTLYGSLIFFPLRSIPLFIHIHNKHSIEPPTEQLNSCKVFVPTPRATSCASGDRLAFATYPNPPQPGVVHGWLFRLPAILARSLVFAPQKSRETSRTIV